jgi:hypothetical protein
MLSVPSCHVNTSHMSVNVHAPAVVTRQPSARSSDPAPALSALHRQTLPRSSQPALPH